MSLLKLPGSKMFGLVSCGVHWESLLKSSSEAPKHHFNKQLKPLRFKERHFPADFSISTLKSASLTPPSPHPISA
ncbi:hypothetical protein NQZ68_007498 [Dissostichus eleginoides]|nr:hypothetical protein NQZ68_007498 [Dissostichus eleginoides]